MTRRSFLQLEAADVPPAPAVRVARRPFAPGKCPVSILGFGGIHFPVRDRNKNAVDVPELCRVVDRALALGVNYFDTGYIYHDGNGERALGEALARHPRESFLLGDKMCTWRIKTRADAECLFAEQLARCRVKHFDFYMLHSIGDAAQYRRVYKEAGVLAYLREEVKRGRIRYLGFSHHGSTALMKEVLADGPWDMCMILLNATVYDGPNKSKELYDTLAAAHVPVWVMEPLAGGRCATLNTEARALLEKARPGATPASWALRFAASHPNVACVLSGMGRMEHLVENGRTLAEGWKPLSADESATYRQAVAAFLRQRGVVGCTGCGYCEPCPYGVAIPEVFAWWNRYASDGLLPTERSAPDVRRAFLASYRRAVPPLRAAERCIGCRACLKACPQWTFRIPVEMEKIDRLVEQLRRLG